jgi:hypothetical protein
MKTSGNTSGKEYMFRGEEVELGIYSVGQQLVLGTHVVSHLGIKPQTSFTISI